MIFKYLTPPSTLFGQSTQFTLSADDAMFWITVHRMDDPNEQNRALGRLLAVCPEVLVWCLAQVDSDGMEESLQLDLIAPFILASEWYPSLSAADTVAAPFDTRLKHKYCKTLSRLFDPEYRHAFDIQRMHRKLSKLIAESLHLPESKVGRWLARIGLDHDFWATLSLATRDDATKVIDISFMSFGELAGPETDQCFEQRLQQEKLASMKQLAYGASHEINNPLANIASRAQTLMLDEADPDRRMRLAKINEQAFRAHEMIADMMLFAHPPDPEISEADAGEVTGLVVKEMQPLADAQGTLFQWSPASVPGVAMDPNQIAVALRALMQNSLESLVSEGTVSIQLETHDDPATIAFSVADDGPGIPPEQVRHIFDPFFSGREAGRGLGFGLSKAWRIAELHGGQITAENLAPGGVRFCLRIPYRKAA